MTNRRERVLDAAIRGAAVKGFSGPSLAVATSFPVSCITRGWVPSWLDGEGLLEAARAVTGEDAASRAAIRSAGTWAFNVARAMGRRRLRALYPPVVRSVNSGAFSIAP